MPNSSIQRKVDSNNNAIDIFSCSIDTITSGLENSTGNYIISKGSDLTDPYLTINGNNGDVIITNNLVVKGTTTTSNTTSVNLETTNLSIGLKDEVIMSSMKQVSNGDYINYKQYANITFDSSIDFSNNSNIKLKGVSTNNQNNYNITYPSESLNNVYDNVNLIPNSLTNFGFTDKNCSIYDVTDSLKNSSFYFNSIFNAHLASQLTSTINATDTVINVSKTNGWDLTGTVLIRDVNETTTIDSATNVIAASPVNTIKVTSIGNFIIDDYVASINSVGSHFVLGKISNIDSSSKILTFYNYISGSLSSGTKVYKLHDVPFTSKTSNTITLSQALGYQINVDSSNLQIFNADSFIGKSNLFYFAPGSSSSPISGPNSLILKISTVKNDEPCNYIPIFDNSPPDIKLVGHQFCTLRFDPYLTIGSSPVNFTLNSSTMAQIQSNTTNDGMFSLDFNFTDYTNAESTKSICVGSDANNSTPHYDSIYLTKMEDNSQVTYFEFDYGNNQINLKNGASIQNDALNILSLNATDYTIITSTTESTNSSNGALIVAGGLGVSKNTNIGGTLGVSGVSTLNGALTVNTGLTQLNAGLGVSGVSTLNGTVTVNSGLTQLNAGLGVSGPTNLSGTLGVTGASTLNGTVTVNSGLTQLNAGLGVSGASILNGTITVNSGLTQLNAGLGVSGPTNLLGTLGITGASTLNGTVTVNSGLTQLNAGLGVSGPTNLLGDLGVTGDSTFNGTIIITDNTDSISHTTGSVVLNGGIGIAGSIHVKGDHTVQGNLTATSSTTSSDARLKTDITPIDNSLNKVLNMNGVYYNWIDTEKYNDRHQVGLIAQEVEKIVPELVLTDDNGLKSVNYSQMVAVLIEAIKEQNSTIQNLRNDVELLKAKKRSSKKSSTL